MRLIGLKIFAPLLCLILPGLSHAEEISSFDVALAIGENGSLHISENIDYDFAVSQRHGIYRDIPDSVQAGFGMLQKIGLSNFDVQMDGASTPWIRLAGITDAGPTVQIKIGRADQLLTATHRYSIRYDVTHGVLSNEENDAVRWNVTGTGWIVPIRSATVRSHLPAKLSRNSVRVSTFTGPYGSVDNNTRGQWLDDHTYVASASRFHPHEGLTVEFAFQKGVLGPTMRISAQERFRAYVPWMILLLIATTFFYAWWRFGKDPSVGSIVVKYVPPVNLDAAQAALIKDELIEPVYISAAILELARDGYLTIEAHRPEKEMETLPSFDSQVYTLMETKKTGAASDLPPYKFAILKGLFDGSNTLTVGEKLSSDRSSTIDSAFRSARSALYDWSVQQGLLNRDPVTTRLISIGVGLAILSLFFVFTAWITDEVPFRQIFDGIPYRSVLLYSFWGIVLCTLILGWNMPTRTLKGTKRLSEILGFREFMQRVDSETIKQQLSKDPMYLDKTLPFAVVLGVAEHWLRRFQTVGASPPGWYSGTWHSYAKFTANPMPSEGISCLSSSCGGSSGGGSFSGGGMGGGGGGSW